jgi:hypothetical protein
MGGCLLIGIYTLRMPNEKQRAEGGHSREREIISRQNVKPARSTLRSVALHVAREVKGHGDCSLFSWALEIALLRRFY